PTLQTCPLLENHREAASCSYNGPAGSCPLWTAWVTGTPTEGTLVGRICCFDNYVWANYHSTQIKHKTMSIITFTHLTQKIS
ncbi:hypothetical protein EI555_009463, partial [Monodon monoceros]